MCGLQPTVRVVLSVWVTAGLLALACQAAGEAPKPEPKRPRIEVVFVLDTTGSMSGLLHAAKEKIWSIANTLAMTKPAPEIKMGLVGYRDRGDQYVTKSSALTEDLDAVYKDLMAFQAGGGGDDPESVNQALYEAVTKMPWSTDNETYRVLFLVGDCPPHTDYPGDVQYPETCRLAVKAGIIINCIQCGNHSPTTPVWQEIAQKAEGRFFRVDQSGSAILAATPFDKELADLATKLDGTRIYYGLDADRAVQAKREAVSAAINEKASAAALAQRAEFNAKAADDYNFLGHNELVNDIANGKVTWTQLKTEQLPANMQPMTPAQREEFVRQQLAERKRLQEAIVGLAAKRQAYVEQQLKDGKLTATAPATALAGAAAGEARAAMDGAPAGAAATAAPAAPAAPPAPGESLEGQLSDTIRRQAAKKGLVYEAGQVAH